MKFVAAAQRSNITSPCLIYCFLGFFLGLGSLVLSSSTTQFPGLSFWVCHFLSYFEILPSCVMYIVKPSYLLCSASWLNRCIEGHLYSISIFKQVSFNLKKSAASVFNQLKLP